MQNCSVKWQSGQDVRCSWHRKRSAIMTVISFLSRILRVQRPVDYLRHDSGQRRCREKRFMYFVPVIGQMNLRIFFSTRIISCLILRHSFFVSDKEQKKRERVWDFGLIRNVPLRKDMRFMIPVRREAVWERQEHSGMKHSRKIRSFWIYWMVFISIPSVSRIPTIWRPLLFL